MGGKMRGYTMRTVMVCAMLACMAVHASANSPCSSDSDCSGGQVCKQGVSDYICRDPNSAGLATTMGTIIIVIIVICVVVACCVFALIVACCMGLCSLGANVAQQPAQPAAVSAVAGDTDKDLGTDQVGHV